MALTQDGRQLYLQTPLGNDFLLINKFRAAETLSTLFRFELEIQHEENEASHEPTTVEIQKILGQNVTVRVRQRDETERFFNGIVAEFSQGQRNERFSFYRAVVVPQVWMLTQVKQSRIFQHVSVPDILRKVFAGYEVSYEIQGTFEPRNYCVQYRESDFDFAARLMEEEGIYYYFEHANGQHKLVLANTPQSHRDCPTKAVIPFALDVGTDDDYVGSITGWHVSHRLQTGKYTLWDYHFQLPTNKLDAEQPSRFNAGGNQELEIYDFPGGYARRFDGISKDGGEQNDRLQKVFDDKQRTTQIRQQELDAQYKTIRGASDCASLTAGLRFKLIKHPNNENNIQHVITAIEHEIVQSPAYESGDEIAQNYASSFTCIPHGAGNAPYRPPRKTAKPKVAGTQTATVVGPAGEEIFTDKYGRVKVQFHWDRELRFDPDSSCWVRVARDMAGNKWGTMYLPRVGQEVIVDFIEGDPDQPIITGAVYNPETMPHYELPKFKTLTYIKTRTSPDDGKGYNELRFEDKKDKEQVFIRSQKRMDVRVRSNFYETCGGNRQEIIGVRADDKPGGNLATTVGGDHDFHLKGNEFIGIDGSLNVTIKGDRHEDIQSNLYTQAAGNADLNARNITLEAMMKITLKVGGNFITIDQSGVTISGMMVKINSGGAGMGTVSAYIQEPLDAETADTGEPGYLERPRSGGPRRGRTGRYLDGQHAPPFPTRTLPNGDIQVGNAFTIRNDPDDPTFQDKVLRDMTTMSNYPTGMDTMNSLNNSGQPVVIQHTAEEYDNSCRPDNFEDSMTKGQTVEIDGTTYNGTGNGTGSTINYNPDFDAPTDADPTVNRPADVGLHHEMAHADHNAHGEQDRSHDDEHPNNPHMEESNTIDRDNQYRDERGVPRRTDHTTM